jgi:hypothetical protein
MPTRRNGSVAQIGESRNVASARRRRPPARRAQEKANGRAQAKSRCHIPGFNPEATPC